MKPGKIGGIYKVVLIVFAVNILMGGISFAGSGDDVNKVNINTATVKELTTLHGIGKKKAEAIVAYRSGNGEFSSIDDLQKVEGIGRKTFEKIRGYLTVEGG